MQQISFVLKLFFGALATFAIAYELYTNRNRLGFVWEVWKRFRFKMFFEVLGVITLVVSFIGFVGTYVPILQWGWLNLISEKGGNLYTALATEAIGSSQLVVRLFSVVFFTMFLAAIPYLAHYEEKWFRSGHLEWDDIAKQSVKFGFVHLLVGVPVVVAIPLIGAGFFLACKYRSKFLRTGSEDEAVMHSTAYHSLYNSVLILLLLVVALIAI